ncbi:MAG TPA: 50S ribosomal protein L23 [Chitinophagales bacterium]|jgi:large subunit ribosomal protein L23|nr:50S ribosomal protein L23 [Chitinophagales bacterium]
MAKRILIKPLITEKTTKLNEANGTYGFVVGMDANKIEIKRAIEQHYGVKVENVRTVTDKGKFGWNRTPFGISQGTKGRVKKAYITLKQGETIDFFSTI